MHRVTCRMGFGRKRLYQMGCHILEMRRILQGEMRLSKSLSYIHSSSDGQWVMSLFSIINPWI